MSRPPLRQPPVFARLGIWLAVLFSLLGTVFAQGIIIIHPPPPPPPPPLPAVSPTNDNFAEAIELPSVVLGYTTSYNSAGATLEPGESSPLSDYPRPSVWWKWTPTRAAVTTLHCGQSDMAVFRGDSVTNLQLVALGHPAGLVITAWGGYTTPDTAEFTNEVGVTYHIADLSNSSYGTTNTFRLSQKLQWVEQHVTSAGKPVAFTLAGATDLAGPTNIVITIALQTSTSSASPIWDDVADGSISNPTGAFWTWIPAQAGEYSITKTLQYASGEFSTSSELTAVNANNDLLADAQEISPWFLPVTVPFRTDFATFEPDEPLFGTNVVSRTVWFHWAPTHSSRIRLRAPISNSSGGLPIDVFTGASLSTLTRVANNDYTALNPMFQGYTSLQLQSGSDYYIRVGDPNGMRLGGLMIENFDDPAPALVGLSTAVGALRTDGTIGWDVLGKVYGADGQVASNAFAAFYAGLSLDMLKPYGTVRIDDGSFNGSSELAGTVSAGVITIPFAVPGQDILVQLRAWAPNAMDYTTARKLGLAVGKSQFVKVSAGSELIGPAVLRGIGDVHLETASAQFNPGVLAPLDRTGVKFQLSGSPGIYVIDAGDFSYWQPLGIFTNQVGTIEFTDTRATKGRVSLYRARLID